MQKQTFCSLSLGQCPLSCLNCLELALQHSALSLSPEELGVPVPSCQTH